MDSANIQKNAYQIVNECHVKECECKSCVFRGKEGLCIGCTNCSTAKELLKVSACTFIKRGHWDGFAVGAFGDKYLMNVPSGICDIPAYYPITKEEYDSFNQWCDEEHKILNIQNRAMRLKRKE